MSFLIKSRFGATLMILGGVLAAAGEIVNARTTDVLTSSWRLSLVLIVFGVFILLIGLSTFASASPRINGFGFVGSNLIVLGGLLMLVGTVALDWIIVPFLINLANAMAATINNPATATQNEINAIIASINSLGGSVLQKLFPNSTPHISAVHIPVVNGTALVNKVLLQLHLPTLNTFVWWGHFSLTAGPLTLGCLVLGLALQRNRDVPAPIGVLLISCALLNLLCQFVTTIPPYFSNITAIALLLTLVWLAATVWFIRDSDVEIVEIE